MDKRNELEYWKKRSEFMEDLIYGCGGDIADRCGEYITFNPEPNGINVRRYEETNSESEKEKQHELQKTLEKLQVTSPKEMTQDYIEAMLNPVQFGEAQVKSPEYEANSNTMLADIMAKIRERSLFHDGRSIDIDDDVLEEILSHYFS